MAVEITSISDDRFEWVSEDDPDVRAMVRPASVGRQRQAARISGAEITQDETIGNMVAYLDFEMELCRLCLDGERIAGVMLDGEPATLDDISIYHPDILLELAEACRAEFKRLQELSGNLAGRPSGSPGESTVEASH